MSLVVRMLRTIASLHPQSTVISGASSRNVAQSQSGTLRVSKERSSSSILTTKNLSVLLGGGCLISVLTDADFRKIVTYEQGTNIRQVRTMMTPHHEQNLKYCLSWAV